MFRNNKIAEMKNNYSYLKVDNSFKHEALKILEDWKFHGDILEGSDAFYIGESSPVKLQQLEMTFRLLGVQTEMFKHEENYIESGILKNDMD